MAKPRSNSGIAAVSEITRTINKIMEPQCSFYTEEKLPLGPYLSHASLSTVSEIPFSHRKFGIIGINIIELKKTVKFSIVPKVLDFSVVSDSNYNQKGSMDYEVRRESCCVSLVSKRTTNHC